MNKENVLMNKDLLFNIISFLDLKVTKECYCCGIPLEYSLYIFKSKQSYIQKYNYYNCRTDYICNDDICIDIYKTITDINYKSHIFALFCVFLSLFSLFLLYLLGKNN